MRTSAIVGLHHLQLPVDPLPESSSKFATVNYGYVLESDYVDDLRRSHELYRGRMRCLPTNNCRCPRKKCIQKFGCRTKRWKCRLPLNSGALIGGIPPLYIAARQPKTFQLRSRYHTRSSRHAQVGPLSRTTVAQLRDDWNMCWGPHRLYESNMKAIGDVVSWFSQIRNVASQFCNRKKEDKIV
ncbi:hypothetical protein KIN20_012684 [Parelaphostrongylus tenuis]|uniref:Uncharacterized protein n=1 Tax=Parelaphostrongylus tenuis TaxID=148309 RepID=A0AAD5MTP0_PARTN|nr:hypothetical protein KIN20_012684 [Parelaphostrongylus tenuis]